MYQALGMLAAFGLGMVLFVMAARAAALHLKIGWRDALMYFGVLLQRDEGFSPRRAAARPRRR
jgi:hypothetical protein